MLRVYRTRVSFALTVCVVSMLLTAEPSKATPPSAAQRAADKDRPSRMFPHQQCKSLDEAIALAEDELNRKYSYGVAAIVYTVNTPDEQTLVANTKLLFIGKHGGGYMPGTALTDGATLKPVIILRASQPIELQITAPGFQKYKRKAILHAGELLIWDDIVLKPITEHSAATVKGHVYLEDEEDDVEGLVISIDNEAVAFTDDSGYFEVDLVRAGKLRISAYKPGYVGMSTDITVSKGNTHSCELIGYYKRSAHVHWAYQPNGTRSFDGRLQSGTAILTPRKLWRISFENGFKQIRHDSDMVVIQVEDKLVMRHWYSKGKIAQSVLANTTFRKLDEAPKAGYKRTEKPLSTGDVYIIRCRDGKHYSKMEIIDITNAPATSG